MGDESPAEETLDTWQWSDDPDHPKLYTGLNRLKAESRAQTVSRIVETLDCGESATAEMCDEDAVFANMFELLDRSLATVIVEHEYFDLDYRSEYAARVERQFRFGAPGTTRLHLFDTDVGVEEFATAVSGDDEAAKSISEAYLGYAIVRPEGGVYAVGRSLFVPRRTTPPIEDDKRMISRLRTLVTEETSIAGIPVTAYGVPFTQQDGVVTRCAHATAWMAHYTAVLRAFVSRVPIAALDEVLLGADYRIARSFPSPGMIDQQTAVALTNAGLPPMVNTVGSLDGPRRVTPFDDRSLHQGDPSWHHERFTTEVCVYLNSGFPVIIAQGVHAYVICGYVRRAFLPDVYVGEYEQALRRNAVAAFVTHDDELGPYRILNVGAMLREMASDDAVILVPLPLGINLGGQWAETAAAEVIEDRVEQLTASMPPESVRRGLNWFRAKLKLGDFSLRTYVSNSTDFKESFRRRCDDSDAVQMVSAARLPKYVWVTEVVERNYRRGESSECVVGEVLIDATAADVEAPAVVMFHVPTLMAVYDIPSGMTYDAVCGSTMYKSGRWQRSNFDVDDRHKHRRFKSASR